METPLSPLEFLRRARRLYPDREAVVDEGLHLTYSEFGTRCDRWSAALQHLGISKGDRVAYIAPNTHSQLESFYAVPQIGAVLVPGAKAPKLITRAMLKKMRPGSVFVDIAIDQGGCAETSRATTHEEPIYIEEGVTHYCVANMPGAYARTSTQALSNATARYVELLADLGLEGACKRQPALTGGINVRDGKITYAAVAEAHGV